jgi:sugar phosphate isomerase/epimerase
MFPSLNPGHIGINLPFRDGLALAERHGFGGYDAPLDVLHAEVTGHGAAAVRDLFLQHGLRIGAWNLPFMPDRVTEAEWRDWLAKLPPMLESARALGAVRCGMWVLPGCNERDFTDNFAFHVTRFKPIARLLADQGMRLGLEFIGPDTMRREFKHPFVHTLAGVLALTRAIGADCGLLLDAWHWHCSGGTRAELRGLTRAMLVHVHVNDAPPGVARTDLVDNRRKLPGTTGVIDLAGFMQALADAGYDGPVTAEPFDAEITALPPEESAARTAKATRAAVARAVRTMEAGR